MQPQIFKHLLFGSIAGIAGAAAMTIAMNLLHRRLPARDSYPLPPREITEAFLGSRTTALPLWTVAAHFAYGAFTASAFAAAGVEPRISRGALYGVCVWAGSYLGWIPAVRLLKPAYEHPSSRNGLMLLAHLVWGGSVAAVLQSLQAAEREAFGSGQLRDTR